jgi:hypothetical protein
MSYDKPFNYVFPVAFGEWRVGIERSFKDFKKRRFHIARHNFELAHKRMCHFDDRKNQLQILTCTVYVVVVYPTQIKNIIHSIY